MNTDYVVNRFRQERQILASLEHPNIAQLQDGGTTEEGLPYFVMEYIDGEPITRYCHSQALTISERLQLFRNVCSAIQHAHQKLVIHRDIILHPSCACIDGTNFKEESMKTPISRSFLFCQDRMARESL